MRIIRIYQPGNYFLGHTIELTEAAAQHVAVVLRMQSGDKLTLFRGDNHEFTAEVTAIHKKKVRVIILAVQEKNRESPRVIHLAQALSKGERMEFVIQKAAELGVTSITPLLTSRSVIKLDAERLAKKHAQWQAIAIAACEQCGRNTLPIIRPPTSLPSFLQQCQAAIKLILHPLTTYSWRDFALTTGGDIALLIGPEGGLSEEEVDFAKSMQFQPLCLGPRILRTETAAITALSILQAIGGDL